MYYRLPPPPPTLETQNSSSEEVNRPAKSKNKLSFEGVVGLLSLGVAVVGVGIAVMTMCMRRRKEREGGFIIQLVQINVGAFVV
jgi:hypothetical protein